MATKNYGARAKRISRRGPTSRRLGSSSGQTIERSIDAGQPDPHARKHSNDHASWSDIEREYRDVRFALIPFTVPTEKDIEQYRLSRATNRISSPFLKKIDRCEWIYSRDSSRRELLKSISYELGLGSEPPPLIEPPKRLDWRLIESSISRRELSPEFVGEWGKLSHLFARYIELVHNSRLEIKEFTQAFDGDRGGSKLLHKHWYARWIEANSRSLLPKIRTKANDALVEVCFGIVSGKISPPENFTAPWFGEILVKKGHRYDSQLKDLFCELSAPALRRMLAFGGFPEGTLPPIYPPDYGARVPDNPTPRGRVKNP